MFNCHCLQHFVILTNNLQEMLNGLNTITRVNLNFKGIINADQTMKMSDIGHVVPELWPVF